MSELAFTKMGQRFTPPEDAAWWAVHLLLENRGVKTLYDQNGAPLRLPIAASFQELRAAVRDAAGRYRLIALDSDLAPIADAPRAYVRLPPQQEDDAEDDDAPVAPPAATVNAPGLRNATPPSPAPTTVSAPFGTWPALPMPGAMTGSEYLVGEALRAQVQTQLEQMRHMTAMITATLAAQANVANANATGAAQMMNAAAELLRAADGAAMPRRPPAPAPLTPPPPPAPTSPPTSSVVYATPRNAGYADDEYEADDEYDDGDEEIDDEAAPIDATGEDFFSKAQKLVATVAQAIGPVADMAKVVMGAGLGGLGGLFGGGSDATPRNAASTESVIENAPMPGHLRTSHVLAVSHELDIADGSLFRQMIVAMEPADREMFVGQLCELPLEEAVRFAAENVTWLKARLARSRRAERVAATPDDNRDGVPTDETDDDLGGEPGDDELHRHDGDDDADESLETDEDDRHDHDELEDDAGELECSHDESEHVTAPDDDDEHRDVDTTRVPTDDEPVTHSGATIPAPEVPRPLTPDVIAHMQQIAKHLHVREVLQAQALINGTSAAERNRWIERLMALDPQEGATVVRAELARRASAG